MGEVNSDAEMTQAAKQQCLVKPNVLLMIAVAGVYGQKPVWMAKSGNVILPLAGPAVNPASKEYLLTSRPL